MIPVERCPVCDGSTFAPFAMDRWQKGRLHATQARCTSCGLLASQPQASPEEMDAYYRGPYYETAWPDGERAWRENAPMYRAHELPVLQALWADEPPPVGGAVAEVGCGYGVMLRVLREEGYVVSGCELADRAVRHCRELGLDVVPGKSPGLPLPRASFDLVLSMHVIEHVPDPLGFVEEMATLLRPGGILAVGTEDAFISQYAWQRTRDRLLGRIPAFRSSSDHTFVFEGPQLARLMSRAGLSSVRTRSFDRRPPDESLHWRLYKGLFRTIDRLTGHGEFLMGVGRRP